MAAETRPLDSTPFTYHWLASGRAEGRPSSEDVVPALWVAEGWHSFAEAPTITPAEMYRRGWRYHGPVAFPPGLDDAPDLPPLAPTLGAEDAAMNTEVFEALKLILPLAKGYVAKNRVGNNEAFIRVAEAAVRSRAAKQEVRVETEELPGDMLNRLGDDASKWAAEFCKTASRLGHPGIDEGWMIGWFANAIEHSCAVRRWATEKNAPSPEVVGLRDAVVEAAMARWKWEGRHNRRIEGAADAVAIACTALDAALTPPEPVDPRVELDDAVVDVLTVVDMSVRSNAQKVARVSRARAAMAREAK